MVITCVSVVPLIFIINEELGILLQPGNTGIGMGLAGGNVGIVLGDKLWAK
jgi:hypothetical protein